MSSQLLVTFYRSVRCSEASIDTCWMYRKQLESELLPEIHENVEVLRQYRDDLLSHLQSPSTLRVAASSLHSDLIIALIV